MSSASLVTVLTPGALGLGGESMIEIARSLPASGHWIAGAALGTAGSTGALDPDHELVFAIPQLNLEYLKTLHSEVSDPTHPKYGQYLGFEEVGDLVRNEKSMRVVRAWLTDAGVSECTPTKHLEYVRCVAPTSKWNSVLDAQFREYRSAVATAASVVRAPKVHVPSFVREHLSGILLASELPPPRTQGGEQQQQQRSPSRSASAGGYCDTHPCCTPTLLNKVYNFTTNSGSGLGSQSVFETGTQTMSPADLAKFQTKYASMAAPQPIAHDIGGNVDDNTCKYLSFECGEANLDIQYIMAQAQDVPTTFWSCQECSFANWITQVANMAKSPLVHSISYGQDESQTGPTEMDAFSTEAMKLGVKGITVLASSGDDGVAGPKARSSVGLCAYNPQWPASCPYVTTVGATQGPEEGGNPEVVCAATNNNTFITTGGGFSAHFATPSYQSSAVQGYLSNTMSSFGAGFNAKGRGYPDVALIGHLYPIFVGGEQEVKDGTSASTPVMAAIISLVNAKRLALKKPTVGFANPALYKWAGDASIFHDITSGSNECTALGGGGLGTLPVCCPHSGFRAEKGWDAATGLGSVNVGNIIEAWAAL